ncbi:hypothetical protein [Nocardia pseudovaccinii]|nr:hypothetical protein [Nocardia pseudovaccinii]
MPGSTTAAIVMVVVLVYMSWLVYAVAKLRESDPEPPESIEQGES